MKEDIYFRVNCFYYYALSNSLYLIFYLLPYVSQITNQVFYLWIILKTRPSQISFRLSYSPIFSIIHFLIKIVEFFNCSDDKHPLNIGLKLNFFITSQICQLNQETWMAFCILMVSPPQCQSHWNTCKMPQFHGRFYVFLPSPLSSAAYHNEAWTVHFQNSSDKRLLLRQILS